MLFRSTSLGKTQMVANIEGPQRQGDYLILRVRTTDHVVRKVRVALSFRDVAGVLKALISARVIGFMFSPSQWFKKKAKHPGISRDRSGTKICIEGHTFNNCVRRTNISKRMKAKAVVVTGLRQGTNEQGTIRHCRGRGCFGGSTCAALLAKRGLRVLLLDKNPHAGGRAVPFCEGRSNYNPWFICTAPVTPQCESY